LLVAEIQQSSDATFRLFDWNRVGLDGKPRELHVACALNAVNWNQGPIDPVVPVPCHSHSTAVRVEKLVEGNGFRLERYFATGSFPVAHVGEMTIWMVLEGSGVLSGSATGYQRLFTKGDTVVVPASANGLSWEFVSSADILTLLCVRLQGSTI
jgi:mannose-6-phosphate isomerase